MSRNGQVPLRVYGAAGPPNPADSPLPQYSGGADLSIGVVEKD
jgi:hypothetical protein